MPEGEDFDAAGGEIEGVSLGFGDNGADGEMACVHGREKAFDFAVAGFVREAGAGLDGGGDGVAAALDAVEAPSAASPWWTWRVVLDANLQLQSTTGLLGSEWEDAAEPFTATGQTWTLDEPFTGHGKKFYRLIWNKD